MDLFYKQTKEQHNKYLVLETTPSTQEHLLADVRGEDRIVVAVNQTAGIGRNGTWFSSESFLKFSFRVFADCQENAYEYVMHAAIKELTRQGVPVIYKRPNDLICQGKHALQKIGGIVLHYLSLQDPEENVYVIGVGINVEGTHAGYSSIRELTGICIDVEALVQNIVTDVEATFSLVAEAAMLQAAQNI